MKRAMTGGGRCRIWPLTRPSDASNGRRFSMPPLSFEEFRCLAGISSHDNATRSRQMAGQDPPYALSFFAAKRRVKTRVRRAGFNPPYASSTLLRAVFIPPHARCVQSTKAIAVKEKAPHLAWLLATTRGGSRPALLDVA